MNAMLEQQQQLKQGYASAQGRGLGAISGAMTDNAATRPSSPIEREFCGVLGSLDRLDACLDALRVRLDPVICERPTTEQASGVEEAPAGMLCAQLRDVQRRVDNFADRVQGVLSALTL